MYEFLLIFGVVLWCAMALFYVRTGLASIYHPATYYLFFHGLIFVFRPILGYFLDYQLIYRLYGFSPDMYVKDMVLVGADLGFVSFMLAAIRFGRRSLVLAPTRTMRYDSQRENRRALGFAAILLAPIGTAALLYWLRINSTGVTTMVTDTKTHSMINTDTSGYFTGASDFIGALSVLIAWQYRFKLISLIPLLLYVGIRASSGGGRWSFLLTTASACLLYLYDRKKKWPDWRSIVLGAIVLALFVIVGQQRDIIVSMIRGEPVRNQLFTERFMEGMDFGNLEYYEFIVWTIPNKTGTWGYFVDNLQLLTEPIPRILWPGKPSGPPIPMWDLSLYGNPIGMTGSLPGTGWAELGLPGVVLWCGLGGLACAKFYNWFARSAQTGFQVGAYMMLLPMTVQIFRDGGVLTAAKFPLFFLITVFTWKIFSTIVGRTQPRAAPYRGFIAPK